MPYAPTPQRVRQPVTSYTAAHDLNRATLGHPSEHDCITCGGTAHEWALMPGSPDETVVASGQHAGKRFSPNPDDYASQCRSCHRRMDAQIRKARKAA